MTDAERWERVGGSLGRRAGAPPGGGISGWDPAVAQILIFQSSGSQHTVADHMRLIRLIMRRVERANKAGFWR